jgi:hypothetical protein
MEGLEETTKNISSKLGFFKYVFNFDDDSKTEIMNVIQYSILSIIPIVILNKISQKYIPEADEEKGSLEILAEVVIQILVMFLGILFINRIITYIPTYTGKKYHEISITNFILPILMVILSLQTKLGEKVSILVDRISSLWNGNTDVDDKNKNKKKGNVKVSQPISGHNSNFIIPQQQQQQQQHHEEKIQTASNLYGGSTSISQLPNSSQEQNMPDYNSMFQNTYTPMPGAATPGMQESFAPLAANEIGGGAFGSAFGGGF